MNGKAGQRGPKYHRAMGGREATYYKYTGQTAAHASLNGSEPLRRATTRSRRETRMMENLAGETRRGDCGCLLFDITKTPRGQELPSDKLTR
jgi:hypothetical protein